MLYISFGAFRRFWGTNRRIVACVVLGLVASIWSTAVRADVNVGTLFGGTVSIAGIADGTEPFTYQWKKDGVDIPGATSATFNIVNAQSSHAGRYTVLITNHVGSAISDAAVVSLGSIPPSAITQPTGATILSGTSTTLSFNVTGTPSPSIQWQRNGVNIAGATGSTLSLNSATSANSGTYTAVAANVAGTLTSTPVYVNVQIPSRIVNVSTRAGAGAGAQSLIAGFVITGGSKSIMARAVGPGIATYFPAGATLPDPQLTILDGQTLFQANDDWGGTTILKNLFTQLGAFSLTDTGKDAVILSSLQANKAYSAVIGGGDGLAIAEIYDADQSESPAGRLINLSTRTQVGTGANVLIAGFVIAGDLPKQVLIRAIGPTLGQYGVPGVLADPQLDLYAAGGTTPIQSNDNWGGTTALTTAFNQVGAFALPDAASKDAVMLVTLNPGSYSAIVSGVGNTTGVALIEVYDVR
ncbi:MAG: repeat protein [Verrucomicrobia bacterium]|nr:repeat protein [Verrucomicrobiota bacterium]